MNCLAIAAFSLLTLGLSTEAYALPSRVYVRVDNHTNPSGYSNAKSTGTLTVCVTSQYDVRRCKSKVLEVIASDWDFAFDVTAGVTAVTSVEMNFNQPGDIRDLLVVDQVLLTDGSHNAWRTWGVDNETGWCFSSDPGDFDNSHCGSQDVLSPANSLFLTP
jgi:hypothetical protein